MADKTIGDLAEALQINDNDLFVLEQGGTAKKLTGQILTLYIDRHVVSVTVEQLPEGSEPTAQYNPQTGVISLGIPKGDTGNGIENVTLNADYTLTINFTDGTSYTTTSIRGAQGVPGANGQDGADGKSAYQSAQDGGYTGTEAQFNSDLAEVGAKQDALVSGTNIKTINNQSVLGSGNLDVDRFAVFDYDNPPTLTEVQNALDSGKIPVVFRNVGDGYDGVYICSGPLVLSGSTTYYYFISFLTNIRLRCLVLTYSGVFSENIISLQQLLVSGDNISTINGNDLLDGEDITIREMPFVTSADAGKFARVNASGEWVAESVPQYQGGSY